MLEDKLREGEITKEDNIVDHDTDIDAEESNDQQDSKETVKEEGKEDSKENIPTIKNEEIQSESDQNINEDKLNTIDVKEETCPVKAELGAVSPVVKPSEGPAAEVAEASTMGDPGHGEARRYLEEVMGIVEDEEFSSQQRLRRLRALKQRRPQAQASRAAGKYCQDQDEASGCVKV